MPDFVTGASIAGPLIGGMMGGDEGGNASAASGFNMEIAQKLLDIFETTEAPLREAANAAQMRLIPSKEELQFLELNQAKDDLSRYGLAAPKLEGQLMDGIAEGTADRTDRRMAESIAAVNGQFDSALDNVGIYSSRRGGTAGDTTSRNMMLQTELAKAGAGAVAGNTAVDREMKRLDDYKISAPLAGLGYFKGNAPNPTTSITEGTTAVTPGAITGAGQNAYSSAASEAEAESDGISGLFDSVVSGIAGGGDKWNTFLSPSTSTIAGTNSSMSYLPK